MKRSQFRKECDREACAQLIAVLESIKNAEPSLAVLTFTEAANQVRLCGSVSLALELVRKVLAIDLAEDIQSKETH